MTGAKQAGKGCGIAICFMGYGEDKMKTKLRRSKESVEDNEIKLYNVRQVLKPGSGTARV